MLQGKTLGAVALLGLLAGAAASADDRYRYAEPYRSDSYRSGPQVRLGVDVVWGGYGYAPAPVPVAWYPVRQPAYTYYDQGYDNHRHRKHKKRHRNGHQSRHRDDCDH